MNIPFDQKAVSTIAIISILLFSGIFGAFINLNGSLNAGEELEPVLQPNEEQQVFSEPEKHDIESETNEMPEYNSRGNSRATVDVGIFSMSDIVDIIFCLCLFWPIKYDQKAREFI